MKITRKLRGIARGLLRIADGTQEEKQMLLLGRILADRVRSVKAVRSLEEVEFRVFSQFGDDGIIQWLVSNLHLPNRTFVEFGVEDYRESNTRFLLLNNNWTGFVMDGSPEHVAKIEAADYFWRHELFTRAAFIDRSNINELIASARFHLDVGLLHVDLDGNDYWVWEAITVISPIIVVLEYNSVFGPDRAISVPYDKEFMRGNAHPSKLYFGASLKALHRLSTAKGYSLVGCNGAGNNAYYVRNDSLNEAVRAVPPEQAFVASKFRENRDASGRLTFAAGPERLEIIRGLPVVNVETGRTETL